MKDYFLVLKSKYVARTFDGRVELLTLFTSNLFCNQENIQSSDFLLTKMIVVHLVEQRALSCFTEKRKKKTHCGSFTLDYRVLYYLNSTPYLTNYKHMYV